MMGFQEAIEKNEKLKRGLVYCNVCEKTLKVDSLSCLRTGWPECCGYTMSLDVPAPQVPTKDAKEAE